MLETRKSETLVFVPSFYTPATQEEDSTWLQELLLLELEINKLTKLEDDVVDRQQAWNPQKVVQQDGLLSPG